MKAAVSKALAVTAAASGELASGGEKWREVVAAARWSASGVASGGAGRRQRRR